MTHALAHSTVVHSGDRAAKPEGPSGGARGWAVPTPVCRSFCCIPVMAITRVQQKRVCQGTLHLVGCIWFPAFYVRCFVQPIRCFKPSAPYYCTDSFCWHHFLRHSKRMYYTYHDIMSGVHVCGISIHVLSAPSNWSRNGEGKTLLHCTVVSIPLHSGSLMTCLLCLVPLSPVRFDSLHTQKGMAT